VSTPIIELVNVHKSFRAADGSPRTVLERLDFTLHEGEIVALLGQSGCGKSTMLRIIAGLVQADAGQVLYRNLPLQGPADGISMVFQSFALFPWLTVQKNVELGLEAKGVPLDERGHSAEEAIELIGLSGFEGALPRELSGGMRQRVGIARALVTQPAVLLMDEAFSSLDVLTGETLRDDILDLWDAGRLSTKAMLVVSHNIEEAVMMADRVLLFASNPGRIRDQMMLPFTRPRDADSSQVHGMIDTIYGLMTLGSPRAGRVLEKGAKLGTGDRLPFAEVTRMEAIVELLVEDPHRGSASLTTLAEVSELNDNELLNVTAGLTLLGFVQVERGVLTLTPLGREFVSADDAGRKAIFGRVVLGHVPLIAYIRHGLEQDPSGDLSEEMFLKLLSFSLTERDAEETLKVAIEWGRYGELFEYDYTTGVIRMPESETPSPAE